ncbi:MAG: hypothetical protein MN733_44395 [Nitrososphaera sp.]|nr:hypothetical protein [Nitrososphaera sp.]
MKCKFCSQIEPDLPELRKHVAGKHKSEWLKLKLQLAKFDEEHEAELRNACPSS